ncbi:hypothetical protein KUL152_30270 [Tenacibaculum sp. KUL152]|nr:hypothetical protein KUL152_30270 [Tenacibaculum sp. KUL152]GFD94528.1 hypothetical protein KUL154_32610 [Alteromonas sp. KUL154]GFD97541.1 hypothetical protein KUL156_01340 [Alteromonas sp. KUL156]
MKRLYSLHGKTCVILIGLLASAELCASVLSPQPKDQWFPIFNGKNLEGWTPKFAGYELGVNYKNTFRVQDGYLTTNYDQYDEFNFEFGHLFYQTPYSHYKLRATYRFLEQQLPGYKNAWKNNGFMIHAQPPSSMSKEQRFPVSLEVQLLGANQDTDSRPTGNVCTPGSHINIGSEKITKHCVLSDSATLPGEQWVDVEITVRGSEQITHTVNGKEVLTYSNPTLDEKHQNLSSLYGSATMQSGFIAIQAENSTVQFKSIEIMPLSYVQSEKEDQ